MLPLALLLVGVVAGSILGLCARVNDWFAPSPSRFAATWASTQLSQEDLSKILLMELHPRLQQLSSAASNAHVVGLFATVAASDCATMKRESGKGLKGHLKAVLKTTKAKEVIEIADDRTLEAVRDVLCAE